MRNSGPLAMLVCTLAACSGSQGGSGSSTAPATTDPAPVDAATADGAAAAGEDDVPPTRYRVGDSIVYVYSGAFTAEPVRMVERVTSQEGNHLRIEVTLTRGAERRQRIQVLTDTPYNQRNDIIDELYEVVDGEERLLPNEGNADIYGLASWTLLEGLGPHQDPSEQEVTMEVAGQSYPCSRQSSLMTWQERARRAGDGHRGPAFSGAGRPRRRGLAGPLRR